MSKIQQKAYKPNLYQDNTYSGERKKQIVFWNMYALNNIHSLAELFSHATKPAQHTQRDHDWKDLFLINKQFIKGQERKETFISRAQRYLKNQSMFDRISWLRNEQFQLKIIKHSFWNKIKKMRAKTYQQKKLMWKERVSLMTSVVIFGVIFNAITQIAKLSTKTRSIIFVGCAIVAEIIFRYKKSDQIFYKIPKLPDPQLQEERLDIIKECLFFDGRSNFYGSPQQIDEQCYKYLGQQQSKQFQYKLAKALDLKVIRQQDL